MIDLELFFKDKPTVPDWFKTHPIFQEIKQTNKIFPSIGLPNFTTESKLENTNTASLITALCSSLNHYLSNAKYYFDTTAPAVAAAKTKLKVNKFAPASKLIGQLHTQLAKPKNFISKFNTTQGLYLVQDIVDSDDKAFARKGESLFKVYPKLVDFCKKHYNYALPALDTVPAFKEYSANNCNGKMQVVFSSDGNDGAWDLLTMSQRGISSCQSWNGQYKNCTIGSVLDPFTAIMYLTTGTPTEFGTKMIRRCIVRFTVDRFMKRPTLYLEYMYPGEHAASMKAFKDALRSKVGDKFPIVSQHNVSAERFYVPYSDMSKALLKHSNAAYVNTRGSHNYYGIFPYRDTYMEYKIKTFDALQDTQFEQSKTTKLTQLGQMFHASTEISDIYIEIIKATVGEETFSKVVSSNNTNDYLRKCCIKYFANRQTISKQIVDKIATELKSHKDKSIFIPGIAKEVKPEKLKKAKKGEVQVVEKVKADSLETTIDKHVVPVVSEMFKTTWSDIVAANIGKPKKIRKTNVKRAR